MTDLSFDDYCTEIVVQTGLLESTIKGADLALPVPSCPGWNVGQLVRHLSRVQRWAGTVVRTRAAQPVSNEHFRDPSGGTREDPAAAGPWLAGGAAQLAEALREAGPGTPPAVDPGPRRDHGVLCAPLHP